jgi:cytochrome c553
MAPVAQHLSDEQIEAVSEYFATAQPQVLDVLN